jgi:hypothetical protein
LLLSTLQLLFWLLVHPSAWRNHIARIDASLPPDFSLAELSQTQWHNADLRLLLIRGYVVWPLLVGLFVWLSGIASTSQVLDIPRGVIGGIAFAVAINVALSVASGLTISVALGIVSGIAGSLAYSVASIWPDGPERTSALVVAIGLAFGIAGSAAFGAASAIPGSRAGHRPDYPASRQMIGIVLGIVIGIVGPIVAASMAISITNNVSFSTARSLVFDFAGGGVNLARGFVFGIAGGIAIGVAVGRRAPWRYGLIFGIVFGILFGAIRAIAYGMAPELAGVGNATLLAALFALSYVLAERIAGPWTGAVAGALGSGGGFFLSVIGDHSRWPILPIGVICIIAGLTLAWWRPILFYPFATFWNLLLYRIDRRRGRSNNSAPSFLRWHAAFWDEYQRFPYIALDEHLLLILKRNPPEGQAALNYLTNSPQRWAAQTSQIELDADNLESCADVTAISQTHRYLAAGELTGPASALLRSFSRLSQDIEAALRQESAYNQRLALNAVEERLDGLQRELTRSSEPYAARFLPITLHWRAIVADHVRELVATVEARQEIDNPYIIGVPLTEQQEIFIGRTDISARIEQLLRDQRRPPLLLYGQRRMGKTSLLNNLGRLLPTTITPLFVDLQGATRADNHAGLLYNIARDMIKSARLRRNLVLPPLSHTLLNSDPFTRFDEWLDEIEQILSRYEQHTALLALDEFETLDSAIAKGRYDEEDVLGMLRHLIQHRPRFKVLLAGSHHLHEFERWASYLINVQVVHISYLQEAEARQLVEQPVKEFTLRYEPEASRRVLALTRGHPFLVQLLCAEIVALKNEQEPAVRRLASLADVEAAIPEALNSGSFFFADIQRNQIDARGLAILQTLVAQGEGASLDRQSLGNLAGLQDIDQLDQALTRLLQRELIEAVEGGYRFQVELIRRSFIRDSKQTNSL